MLDTYRQMAEEHVDNKNVTIPMFSLSFIPEKYDGYTVSAVGYQCLYKNNDIESVVVPNCIQTIGQQAFCQCKNLTSVSLTDGLKKIETSALAVIWMA